MNRTRLALLILVSVLMPALLAQPDRINTPIEPGRTVMLKGNSHPLAEPANDMGKADPELRIAGITLMLKQTSNQRAELEQLLEEQRDPTSPNYHNWLTPEQFANRFGLSQDDMEKVAGWLESKGLSVDDVARSRNWVVLSGTVAQVQSAFVTEIHRYRVENEAHTANATEPSIPAALESIVLGIRGLDDFRPKPRNKVRPMPLPSDPRFTGSGGGHLLAPGDIGTIYNVNPLYSRGINGTGQKLVVVGQTDVDLSDVRMFRKQFGLPANDPQVMLVSGSTDPGTSKDDIGEANIDLDWSGAIAPNATIVYVNSTNVYNSLQYAIDQVLAPVISMSYGYCEPKISSSPASSAAFFRSLAQQANASGITWLAASGDNAAADCDTGALGKSGLAVDLPASVPEVTGVGGTEFNEGSGTYFSATNTASGGSALSYVPEKVWNDTSSSGLAGGGGGASIFFTKPAWQTGPGVPNDGFRDVPDVAFSASADHDGYIVAVNGALQIFGGTSVATPVFAGMISLLNQSQVANGAKSGLGNINPTLYALAQSSPNAFHDVTVGNNIVPCTPGTPNCKNGTFGFSAGPGYDQATGLGSVDAFNLVTAWGGRTSSGTTTAVTANPASILTNGSTVLTATVKAANGTASPTGTVSFAVNKTALGSANLTGSGGTATATLMVNGTQLTTGVNAITASYAGNSSFNASSGSVNVTVSLPTTASAVVPSLVPNPVYQQTDSNGQAAWFFTVRLTEVAGVATTLTDFTFGGQALASQIQNFFGTASIPAHGTLSTALAARNLTVPATIRLTFSGMDASGQKWSQQIDVPFFGRQLSASMALSSLPAIVHQNPNGDSRCDKGVQFYQQLNLQEQNGYGVNLTRFLANGDDYTSSIAGFFGSVRLAPLGSLQAGICWTGITPPTTVSFEIDGTDTNGNKISATASVPFQGPVANGGALSVSKQSLVLSANPDATVTSSLNTILPAAQNWTASVFPANQTTSWLVMSPLGATGPTPVNLTASASGLPNGVYTATLVFQSLNTIPQFVNVPVTLVVGGSSAIKINAVTNAASFVPAAAPGMYLSVFGAGLAPTGEPATVLPLPLDLSGVTATVNGVPAPLQFISSGQLNIQVPYETPVGTAVLGVNNNGRVARFDFQVDAAAPGIFVGNDGSVVPQPSATRGGSLFFYVTGEGDVSPPIPTGAPPAAGTPVDQLPKPLLPVSVTIGRVPARIDFIGNPFLVGLTQINVTVPQNAPLGRQPVIVTVGGVASKPALVTVQ
ncbi:MAG TPA: protease pro-enzyme activation domain-containing protein [Bryobacteraceae bacterium]|nr:protease pro-enzyme activation domain-containing protein [Bryobacteraceae bacterium]